MTRLWLVGMMVMAVGCSDEESSRGEPVADAGAPSGDLLIGDSSGAV
ncbi:MAG: hypothetical protein JRH11_05790 [Deltaproteobacteria bacterium]|nr:hypothetical protein [Deltaproteobacteria bacterium]